MKLFKLAALPAAISVMALSAGVAQAEEAKTGPVFYGMLYLTLDQIHQESKSEPSQWQLNSRNSRVGVKQSIPLQNGLTGFYQVEFGYGADEDKDDVYTRDVFAGLKGDFGQIRAGRFNTPLRRTEGKIDQFNHLLVGDIEGVLGGQKRADNIIEYRAPKFANTEINLAYIPGENEDLSGDGEKDHRLADAFSASVVYSSGALYAGLGLDKNMTTGTNTDISKRGVIGGRSDRVQLVGQLNLGAATVGAIAQHARDSEDSKYKENAFILSTSYTIQAFKLKAQGGLNKGSDSKDERSLYAVGVDYIMDKSSFLTLNYATVDVKPNIASKKTDKAVALGYQLKF